MRALSVRLLVLALDGALYKNVIALKCVRVSTRVRPLLFSARTEATLGPTALKESRVSRRSLPYTGWTRLCFPLWTRICPAHSCLDSCATWKVRFLSGLTWKTRRGEDPAEEGSPWEWMKRSSDLFLRFPWKVSLWPQTWRVCSACCSFVQTWDVTVSQTSHF